MYTNIIIKQIGNFKDILGAMNDYKQAVAYAKDRQEAIHAEGYTDFKVYVEQVAIINPL